MTLRELIDKDPSLLDAKVLGVLPRTADGAIVGKNADLFSNHTGGGGPLPDGTTKMFVRDNTTQPEAHWYLGDWFSTREAAEAAGRTADGNRA